MSSIALITVSVLSLRRFQPEGLIAKVDMLTLLLEGVFLKTIVLFQVWSVLYAAAAAVTPEIKVSVSLGPGSRTLGALYECQEGGVRVLEL